MLPALRLITSICTNIFLIVFLTDKKYYWKAKTYFFFALLSSLKFTSLFKYLILSIIRPVRKCFRRFIVEYFISFNFFGKRASRRERLSMFILYLTSTSWNLLLYTVNNRLCRPKQNKCRMIFLKVRRYSMRCFVAFFDFFYFA